MRTELSNRKPVVAWLLQALLMIAVCLPTGSIFGLNVKIPAFALFSLALALYSTFGMVMGLFFNIRHQPASGQEAQQLI